MIFHRNVDFAHLTFSNLPRMYSILCTDRSSLLDLIHLALVHRPRGQTQGDGQQVTCR